MNAAELLTMLCSPRALTGGTTLVNPTALMFITVWPTAGLAWHGLICRMYYRRKEWLIHRMKKCSYISNDISYLKSIINLMVMCELYNYFQKFCNTDPFIVA